MDIRMPELFGWHRHHEHHEPEHRKEERRGLNFLDPYLSAAAATILIAVVAFALWLVFLLFASYLARLF